MENKCDILESEELTASDNNISILILECMDMAISNLKVENVSPAIDLSDF